MTVQDTPLPRPLPRLTLGVRPGFALALRTERHVDRYARL